MPKTSSRTQDTAGFDRSGAWSGSARPRTRAAPPDPETKCSYSKRELLRDTARTRGVEFRILDFPVAVATLRERIVQRDTDARKRERAAALLAALAAGERTA